MKGTKTILKFSLDQTSISLSSLSFVPSKIGLMMLLLRNQGDNNEEFFLVSDPLKDGTSGLMMMSWYDLVLLFL